MHCPLLVEYALESGLEVEVFSNLVHVSARTWDTFTRPGVRLACSWYSTDPKQHLLITKRNTHARTKANITKALAHGVPLRAGIIGMLDDQNVQAATAELEALGVTDVGVDHLRQVGRGIRDWDATVAELCGNCGDGVLAKIPIGAGPADHPPPHLDLTTHARGSQQLQADAGQEAMGNRRRKTPTEVRAWRTTVAGSLRESPGPRFVRKAAGECLRSLRSMGC
jgi:hypothetical protein